MNKHTHRHILPAVLRFFGLWAGITGSYASIGSTCPCCGKPGCPAGIGIAAIFGALGAFIINLRWRWIAALRNRIRRRKA